MYIHTSKFYLIGCALYVRIEIHILDFMPLFWLERECCSSSPGKESNIWICVIQFGEGNLNQQFDFI